METDRERWTLEGSRGGPLQVARLERDLASMWKSATARTGGTAVSRACASTLVALDVAESGDDDWIGEISRRHPCRVIRVDRAAGEAPEPLTASAGAVCHLRPDTEGMICVEEIRLQVAEEALDRLPSALRSLSIGGLPVVLFAPGPRRGSAFAAIAADVDIVVVDSRLPGDLLADGAKRVRDLAWSRGASLRGALARAAGSGAGRRALEAPRRLQVDHGGPGPAPASALLLAGWVAARLGLEPGGTDPARLAPEGSGEGGLPLAFHRLAHGPADPVGIHLEGRDASLEVELLPAGDCARITDRDGCRHLALRRRSRAQRVIDEIHRRRPDPAYLEALPLARRLCRGREETGP